MDRRAFLVAACASLIAGCSAGDRGTPTVPLADLEPVIGPYSDVARWVPAHRGPDAYFRGVTTLDQDRYRAVGDRFPTSYRHSLEPLRGEGFRDLLTPANVSLQVEVYFHKGRVLTGYDVDLDRDTAATRFREADYSLAVETDEYRVYEPGPLGPERGHDVMLVGDGYLAAVPTAVEVEPDLADFAAVVARTREGDQRNQFATGDALRLLAERLPTGIHSRVTTSPTYVPVETVEDPFESGLVRGRSTAVDGDTVTMTEVDVFRSADAVHEPGIEQYLEHDLRFQRFDDLDYETDGRVVHVEGHGPVDRVYEDLSFL